MRIRSGLIDIIIKKFNRNSELEKEDKFQQYLKKKSISNSKPFKLRYVFNKNIIVESQKIGDMRYFVFNRHYCKKTIFYFHGGSYIDKPNLFHFKFIENILNNKKVCVVMPIYPRLPIFNAEYSHKKVVRLFGDFVSKNEVDEVILMGDSAGGGFALAIAQQIKNKQPYFTFGKQKIILLSPWLDVTTDNKDIEKIKEKDYQLSRILLNKLGTIWANGDTKNPLASPLFGDLDCGEISLFAGTRDILYPDMLILKEKRQNIGQTIKFIEYDNMPHCFMLMPTKEADEIFKEIIKEI